MGLKIACFTDSYTPYNSGVVHSIQTLHKELAQMGHKVVVFAPMYPGFNNNEDGLFRFASVSAPTNRDYFMAIPFPRGLKETLNRIQPDIVHTHHPFGLGWTGLRYARSNGLPLVYTCHTLYEYYSHYLPLPRNAARKIIRKVQTTLGNRCSLIITPSAATRDYLRGLGVFRPLYVVPTGIAMNEFTFREPGWLRRRYHITPGEKIILSVGRLGPEKNMDFVLRCFARIVVKNPITRLVLVGKGPQEEKLKRMATKLDIRSRVVFTGQLPKREVINCYFEADIFVFASISETQGLVIPEAKSAGLPVVAVRANGVSEMVADGIDGFMTSLEPDNFRAKVELLLSNETLRKKMGRQAYLNVQTLSARNYAESVEQIYYSLLSNQVPGNEVTTKAPWNQFP